MKDLADTLDGYLKGAQAEEPAEPVKKEGVEAREDTGPLSRVLRALASDYRQETRAAVDEAVRRARIPYGNCWQGPACSWHCSSPR